MTPDAPHAAARLAAVRAAAIQASYDYLTTGSSGILLKIYSVSDALLCTITIPSLTLDAENYRIQLPDASGICTGTGTAGYARLIGKNGGDGDLLSVGESGAEITISTDDLYSGLTISLSSDATKRRLQG